MERNSDWFRSVVCIDSVSETSSQPPPFGLNQFNGRTLHLYQLLRNGLYLYRAFLVLLTTQNALQYPSTRTQLYTVLLYTQRFFHHIIYTLPTQPPSSLIWNISLASHSELVVLKLVMIGVLKTLPTSWFATWTRN